MVRAVKSSMYFWRWDESGVGGGGEGEGDRSLLSAKEMEVVDREHRCCQHQTPIRSLQMPTSSGSSLITRCPGVIAIPATSPLA